MITVSLVSHRHGMMVARLATRLLAMPEVTQLIVTRNVPEPLRLSADTRLRVIDNPQPKGFGANHNAAFAVCEAPFFCVLNPDIELPENPFPSLLACLDAQQAAVVAPRIVAPDGRAEDSVRTFPTLASLMRKALRGERGLDAAALTGARAPDWVAGMFMLWRHEAFAALGGFDEGFFLYYEDVDLCARAWQAGLSIALCQDASAIHDARRESHRNWRFRRWHLASMARFFFKHGGRQRRRSSS